MKKKAFILAFALSLFLMGRAQSGIRVSVDSDGIPVYELSDVSITAKRAKRRDRARFQKKMRKFNKLRYNVLKVWPYANECAKNIEIIEAELQRIPEGQAQDMYLKAREKFLFGKYEKDIRNLTISQGKVLVKLIDRQSGSPTYTLIRDYKSKTSAFFWNGVGKLFGYDLKKEYDPEEEFAIEVIVNSIENGTNVTYYDYLLAKNNNGT